MPCEGCRVYMRTPYRACGELSDTRPVGVGTAERDFLKCFFADHAAGSQDCSTEFRGYLIVFNFIFLGQKRRHIRLNQMKLFLIA